MGSLSKSLAHDAGKRPNPDKPRTVIFDGQRRAEKYASGVVERFVDLQGNVVEIQLIPPGSPNKSKDAAEARRRQLHRERNSDGSIVGFIEHGKCPVANGLTHQMPTLAAEFAEAGIDLAPCPSDPKVVTVDARGVRTYHRACQHIEALMQSRAGVAKARSEARSSKQESMLELERKKLALAEQQAADTRKMLEKIAERVESKPRRGVDG